MNQLHFSSPTPVSSFFFLPTRLYHCPYALSDLRSAGSNDLGLQLNSVLHEKLHEGIYFYKYLFDIYAFP